jgi:hypothetical protein
MENGTCMCVICHENLESYHTVVKPENCTHSFHVICINIWLTQHRTCPLCRAQITITTQMPWRTLFITTLSITRETILQRSTYTYAFISYLLRRYINAKQWLENREKILSILERFNLYGIRLPFLDLTNRSTAKREKKKWARIYGDLTNGELVRNSKRIALARNAIAVYNS